MNLLEALKKCQNEGVRVKETTWVNCWVVYAINGDSIHGTAPRFWFTNMAASIEPRFKSLYTLDLTPAEYFGEWEIVSEV